MDTYDLLLSPIYAVIILLVAHKFSVKKRRMEPVYKYYVPGLLLKMVGAIALGLVYFFYYKGGDTVNYFNTATTYIDVFFENPDNFFYLYFSQPSISEFFMMNSHHEFIYWVNDPYALFV